MTEIYLHIVARMADYMATHRGARKPRGLRPALRRWSVSIEKIPAIVGDDSEVPTPANTCL